MSSPEAQMAPFRISASPTEDELLAKYFRVLADRSRLRILRALDAAGELSVGQLAEQLDIAQPSVSTHLACLRWCGFVEARRDHRTIYNGIADPRVSEMIELASNLLGDNEEHVAACRRA
jgi:ArsR family transcriptional regulator, cadmium/lead-responsive transcriptional repressor